MFIGQNDGVHCVWDFVLRMGKNEKSLILGVLLSNSDKGSRGQVPVESGEQGQGDLDNGWQCKKKLMRPSGARIRSCEGEIPVHPQPPNLAPLFQSG